MMNVQTATDAPSGLRKQRTVHASPFLVKIGMIRDQRLARESWIVVAFHGARGALRVT